MRNRRKTLRVPAILLLSALTSLAWASTPAASQEEGIVLTQTQWDALDPQEQAFLVSFASLAPVGEVGPLTAVVAGTDPQLTGTEIRIEQYSSLAFQIEGAPMVGSPFVDIFGNSDTVFPSLSEPHFATGHWVLNHFVLSDPTAEADTQVEFTLFEAITGLPTFPPVEGFVTPDTEAVRATSLLYRDGVPQGLLFLGSDPGVPFGTPYFVGEFVAASPSTPNEDKTHVLFVTPDPNATPFPTLTFATEPATAPTYRWQQLRGTPPPIVELPASPNGALVQAAGIVGPWLGLGLPAGAGGAAAAETALGDDPPQSGAGEGALPVEEPTSGGSDGLPGWLLPIIGVTVLAAVTAAVKLGPLKKKGPTLEGDFAGKIGLARMGDPADFLLRHARESGLPVVDGKQKVDFGRASEFEIVEGSEGSGALEVPNEFDFDRRGMDSSLRRGPRPGEWHDTPRSERPTRFAYWVDPETMTMTIGGVDHPVLPKPGEYPPAPEYSPELDGEDPVGMENDAGIS